MAEWPFEPLDFEPRSPEDVRAAEKEEKELYAHRASEEWLKALEPPGTDEHKPLMIVVAGYPATDATVPVITKKNPREIAAFLS